MIIKNLRSISFLILLVCTFTKSYSQAVDISGALKSIEIGRLDDAQNILKRFMQNNPTNPDVIFLDAILTKNAEEATQKYSTVFEKFPKSKYADASLFRAFSYYYSIGLYKKAESFFKRLKIDYPASPYIGAADRSIPDKEETAAIDTATNNLQASQQKVNAKFTIQAGAFLSVENANKLKEQLSKDGFASEVINRVVGASLLKVVVSGKFINEAEAKAALSQIEAKYNLKGRVIPIATKP